MFSFLPHRRYIDIFERETKLVHVDHVDSKQSNPTRSNKFIDILFHDEVEPILNIHYFPWVSPRLIQLSMDFFPTRKRSILENCRIHLLVHIASKHEFVQTNSKTNML